MKSKIVRAAGALSIFFSVLVFLYYLHISYFQVDVVFYSAIFDVIWACIITALISFKLQVISSFNKFEKIQLFAIFLLVGYVLAISVPTVIDRSLSFYILEKIDQRGGGIDQNAFEDIFTTEYMVEHRLVDVRLTEQLQSGTIAIVDGCVQLTRRGRFISQISRYFRQNWLPKNRLLLGEYTDALTDPFRESVSNVSYQCDESMSDL